MAAPAESPGAGCRAILERLIQPVATDPKAEAAALIAEFGTLAAVLAAPPRALARVLGEDAPTARFIALLRGSMLHALRTDIGAETVLGNWHALENYLLATAAHLPDEQLRVLFLNARNALVKDEVLFRGSVMGVRTYPREVLKRAIELGATALILVHNHPSGDPEPSAADIIETRRICEAAKLLDIVVHDHIIVGRHGLISFRARRLMDGGAAAQAIANDDHPGQDLPLSAAARNLRRARRRITHYFSDDLFADPAFDMLLELFADGEEGLELCTVRLSAAIGVPMATAARWVAVLVERGLVMRRADPRDERRTLLRLAPRAAEAMGSYLRSVTSLPTGASRQRLGM